jgi:hypothetical protein
MADIPVFNALVGSTIQPTPSPVQSLDSVIQARIAGAKMGMAVPNMTTAIIQGASQAVDAFQNYETQELQQALQREQLAQQQIRTRQMAEEEQIVGTADSEAQRAALELKAQQDQIALKLAQKKQEIIEALNSQNPDEITQVFTNPGNADVFADPQFARAAFQRAAPYLPTAVLNGFLEGERGRQRQSFNEKFAEDTQEEYLKAKRDFLGSDLLAAILDKNPGMDPYDVLKRADVTQRAGMYKRDDKGNALRDPNTGQLLEESFDPESAKNRFVDIVDRKTKKILLANVPKDELRNSGFQKYRSLAKYHDSNALDGIVAGVIKELKGEKPGVQDSSNDDSVSTRLDEQSSESTLSPVTEEPSALIQPAKPNVLGAKQYLKKVNLLSTSGTVKLRDNDQALTALAIATGLELTPENRSDFNTLLEDTNSEAYRNRPELKQKIDTDIREAKTRIVKSALQNQYTSNQQVYSLQYNEEAVRKHNAQAREAMAALRSGLGFTLFKNPAASINTFDASTMIEVNTPQDLFVLKNFDQASLMLDALIADMKALAEQQATANLKAAEAPKLGLAALRKYK